MAIYDDVTININLNELVEIRAKLISQYDDYSDKVSKGEYFDDAVLDYLGIKETHYGERTIETIELTMEKEKKEREKEFKKNFEMVKLESTAWTLDVPKRKTK